MPKKPETTLKGRSARTGQFITLDKARKDKPHAVIERVPKPGKGVK